MRLNEGVWWLVGCVRMIAGLFFDGADAEAEAF